MSAPSLGPIHPKELAEKVERLHGILRGLDGGVFVAFSGGADSALLAFEANTICSDKALAVTADSPTLARAELEAARAFAARHGLRHAVVTTHELENPAFAANDAFRCYHCKSELFRQMETLAAERGFRHLLFGAIAGDGEDWRPGMKAGFERGARAPLMEAGLNKADVRARSREVGLETWDKPQSACLSSRFPEGRAITREELTRVEKAEAFLKALGYAQCRVRLMADGARIEIEKEQLAELMGEAARSGVIAKLKELGFRFVTVDLEGFRSGSTSPRP